MKRTAVLLVPLALALSAPVLSAEEAPVPAEEAAPGFVPPKEKIEKPYTNEHCLKDCHGVPGFGAGSETGILRDLYLNAEAHLLSTHGQKALQCLHCHVDADPNFHPRVGYPDVDCRACHSEKPSADVFPPDALKRLEEAGIKPPPKEALKGESWLQTKHAKAWKEKNPAAPQCQDCHTAHYMRKSDDPESTVNRANLVETCGYCHVDQVRSYDVGGLLARFRIGAHGKGDLSTRYDVSECLSCHPEEGAHGKEEGAQLPVCPTCHRVGEDREGVELASLHIKPLAANQPVAWGLRWLYTAAFWSALGLGALFALFMGFSSLYRKEEEE